MDLPVRLRLLVCLLLAGLAAGCSGRGEKAKYQDLDRPKAAATP